VTHFCAGVATARYIFVRGVGDLVLDIYRVNLLTGNREPWKHLTPADPAGLIAIGGIQDRSC